MDALYAIGPKTLKAAAPGAGRGRRCAGRDAGRRRPPRCVFPYDVPLNPGQAQTFTLKLFDAKGNFSADAGRHDDAWAVDQPRAPSAPTARIRRRRRRQPAGFVKATVGGVTGTARVRVDSALSWRTSTTSPTKRRRPGGSTRPTSRRRRIRGQQGPAAPRRQRRAPRAHVHRPAGLVELHDRSRRARHRDAPAARRRRPHQRSATGWCSSATARSSSCIRGRRPTR